MVKYEPTLVIEGQARGLDRMAGICANMLGIPHLPMPADWERYGRAAGPVRNRAMLHKLLLCPPPRLVLVFHDDLKHSKGTRDMAKQALRAGVGVVNIRHRRNKAIDL